MALSLERYRQLKAANKIGWNTEALESTGKNIKSFIDGVNGQRQMSGAQWTADEFGKQRQQLDSLRGQLRYMQSYADSLKGTDAARYGKLNESIKSMGAALDESESWFAENRDEEKRKNDYKTKKTGDALHELMQGGTDTAQAAEKYGLNKDELEKNYKDIRAYQKQGLREDKYGGMGFDDLTGVLRSADSMGQRIYDEIRRDYGDGLRNAQDFDRNAVFKSRAEKYGLTQDEVKRIYETFENNEGDKHYQSTALSDEDKAYVARRIIETGSVEDLQALKKTLPKAQYFDGLRYQLNQAIEDKSEKRYYLDIAEQNPRVTKIMEDIAAIDKELPSLAIDTGAPTGHKGQFENITDAQAARASYLRELTAQGYDADKMVRYYKRYKERTENEQSQQALREWTQQNPVTAALGSVASVPVNMVGSVGDVVKVAMARLEELAGGDGWYDPKGTANYTAQNIRGSVNEMIGDENHIGQLLYSTGMSMGDMVLAAAVNAVPVVGQAASNAMFFSSAGVGAANEVIQNGGDINQATAAMIAQGSAELIFERISLDKLESFANGAPVKDAKSYFKNVLKQAFVEGSEEFNTTLANTLTDALINGGNSAVEREIRQYTEQGMSRDEAKTKAWETWLRGVVDDAVGGALSGGVLGGFAGAKNISDYIDLQQSLGGLAVTPEQMSALLGENKAASADAAAALVKENGVDAVLEAVKQNGEKQTRQTAEHFAELRKKGKLDEKDAAALLVKLAREQADTEMTDALAQLAGAETKTDYKARTAQAESYNSDYDLSGAKIAEGKAQAGSSFGAAHPHGMAARGLNREQMTVLGVESSLEEYGRDDRTVTLRLSDGSVTDAAGVTLADFDFDRLLNLASGYDTIGARALLANYETAKANGASLDAYQAAFDALYRAGADGVRFEKAAENPQLRTLSDMIGEQAARAAVEAGNADGEIMVQARQTLVRRVRVPGKKHLGQSRIGVEYGAKDVSDDTKALLNAFAEKIGKQIIFTDRLNADENGLYSGNVIYLNSNLEEHAIFAAALHEAMHNARVYDPEGFRHVQAFVVNYLTAEGKDTDALLGDIAARWGKDAATREVQMEELVCKTVEALAADSEALQRAIENKKNSGILKKVGDALRRIADRIMQYFKGDREQGQRGHNKQAQAFLDDAAALRQMAEMCSEAFENARENEREFGGKENAERFSFAGEKAQTANRSALEQARQMERDGADSEAIRQKTGWHKGYDGKWRFEIGDRGIKILDPIFMGGTLDKLIDHKRLFAAYPQLKKVRYEFESMEGSVLGGTLPDGKGIMLDRSLRRDKKALKKTLIHEIQHAVQIIEGNAGGTSILSEKSNGKTVVFENEQAAYKDLLLRIEEQYNSEAASEREWDVYDALHDIIRKVKNLDYNAADFSFQIAKSGVDVMKLTDSKSLAKAFRKWTDALYDAAFFEKSPDEWARNRYLNNAGEIEARDTAERLNLSEAQRKEKRPDIDRDDVVFADGGVSFSVDEDETKQKKLKELQNEIIQRENPMLDDYHTGIRNADDILTFDEALNNGDFEEGEDFDPSYTWAMAQKAIKSGKITVFSSYPIKQGVFVSPSRMEAESYSGNGKLYKKTVPLTDVAWIDPTQGQYASVSNSDRNFAPNGRYSKDDTIFDDFEDEEWLWQSDESGAAVDPDDPLGLMEEPETGNSAPTENAFDKLVEEDPNEAVYVAFNAAAKTVERTLRSFAGVNPQQADLERVARKVMRQYGIKEKYNPELVGELAADMKAFADDVRTKKKGDFSTFLNALAVKCRGYLEHSGDYTRGMLQEDASKLYATLKNATLILTPYAQSHVLDSYDGSLQALRRAFKGYVNVGLEKDKWRYKKPIYIGDVIDTFAQETGDGYEGISPYFPDGVRLDDLSGWDWLQNLLKNTFLPSFVNPYHEGYRESIDSAALEMAFDVATEIAAAKSEKTAKAKNVSEQRVRELEALLKSNNISDRQMRELEELREAKKLSDKQVRKMEELHKAAMEQQKAIHKAKQEQLNKSFRRAQRRYQQEHMKRSLAEEEVAVLKQMASNGLKSYREQYEQRVKTRNDLEAVRRQMAKLRTMVVNPTNKKFIPVEILHNKAFMDAVESIGENVLLNRRKDIAQKMDELVKEIRQMRGNGDEDFDTAFDAEYAAELQSFVDWIKDDVQQEQADGTKAYKRQGLDAYEIRQLRRVVDELMHRIENARKLLLREDGMLAQEASEAVIRETRAMDTSRAKKLFSGFAQQMMNPLRTVNYLSGFNENSELRKLFYALNEGQRKSLFWQMNAEKLFGAVVERYEDEYKSACNDVVHFDYTADGKGYKVDMTRMQALQVLMTWKRESKSPMNHMKRGGIVVADPKAVAKGNGKAWENARTVPVSYDLINQIIHSMGKFENEYMLTAEHYFNEVSKKAINETFMVTRHREIARSDYYIPVRVDSDYTKSEIQSLKFDFTIEGAGSYKHITPHAPQPILIESLNSVIDRHIAQTGKLYGLDVPLINFKRMFKGTTRFSNEGSAWFEADSVKKALGEKFGKDTVKFIEQVVTDLEAGREEKTDKFSKVAEFLYRNRVRTSLVGNLGVVIKQAASYPTAGLYLSAGDLNKGLAVFAKKGLTKHYGDIIKEIDQHTAQHYIRRKGMSVQEVSDMFRQSKLARKAPTVINPVKWIQGMDCLTTAALWEATKAHVDGKYKKSGAATGTEAYWQEVTALYDTVIEDTQPMYDVLHRSEFQKNKSSVRKFLFPFKTQPMQNMGILANAAAELAMKKDKASRKKFAKAVASQVTSILVFSLMNFATAWMRHRDDRYKDENDELTFSSIMGGVFWDMFTNGVNTIAPIGGDFVLSLGEDIVTNAQKEKSPWNSFAKATASQEISLLNDWLDKFSRAAKLLENQLNGTNKKGIDPWDFTFRVLDVPGSFAEIFGIPYSNLSTIFKGVGNRIKDTQMYGLVNNKGELKTDHITGHILNAYHSGNRKKGVELTRMWTEQKMSEGYTAEKAQSYVQEKLLDGIAATEEAQQAAQAELEGDYATAERLEQALTAQGLDEELVHKAVEKNLNALKESQSTPKAPKAGGKYQLSDAFKAVVGGDEESLAVVKKDLLENGKTEEDIEKYLKSFSQTKELFEDYYANSGERFHRARKILERIYGDELAAKYADFKKRYKDGR